MKARTPNRLYKLGLIIAFMLVFLFLGSAFNAVSAQVKDYVYESIDVDMEISKDSTVLITEKITQRYTGEFHATYRDITLVDKEELSRCRTNPNLQCGGFEYLQIIGLYDEDGNEIDPDLYTLENVSQSLEDRLRIQWIFSQEGRVFNNELFTFTIKYKVFGSLGYFNDYDLVYWNAVFADRDKLVKQATVRLHFPGDAEFKDSNLKVPGLGYEYEYNPVQNLLTLTSENIPPQQEFTVLLKIPKGLVNKYATLDLSTSPSPLDVTVNGIKITNVSSKLAGIPPGDTEVIFSADGYKPQTFNFTLSPGEEKKLEVTLYLSDDRVLLFLAFAICNLLGCLVLPAGCFWFYLEWYRKGRDINRRPIIIPYYSPPEKIKPYLLGSVKDETVNLTDITATIIDTAYRGYIKIKEFESKTVLGIHLTSKDYELIKQKDFADLSPVELKILNSIFDGKDRVTTTDLKNKFYLKIPAIKEAIYAEMVSRNYFASRPDKVRSSYRTKGVVIAILGIVSTFFFTFIPVCLTLSVSLIVVGVVCFVIGGYMPAKTSKGSKIFDEILGFKMYMETAERFRVQDLTPETFEKYLSYAMVFGIEEKWAERFKDIYKQPPDWYEASGWGSGWNTLLLTNALTDFSRTTGTVFASSPSSSASSFSGGGFSGGGWGGGGGFSGGFGGGGGGGGGGGSW